MGAKQSQKTQGFCVADFATLSDERRSCSKIFPLFIWIKEPCVRKLEGLERSKLLGISQTKKLFYLYCLLVVSFLACSTQEVAIFYRAGRATVSEVVDGKGQFTRCDL